MELRAFVRIFIEHKKIFAGIFALSILCGVAGFFLQPVRYKTTLTLNIARDGLQQTQEYAYDDFYRLQADERFANTVTQWVTTPFVTQTVFPHADHHVRAKKLSAQTVSVTYKTHRAEHANVVAHRLLQLLNTQTQTLNTHRKTDGWFVIRAQQPVTHDARHSLGFVLVLAGAIGFFVAFWTVLLTHYIFGVNSDTANNENRD